MVQYNGVTGTGSRVPPHGPASSGLGYGLPGSLSQGACMSGGGPPPPSRAALPFWKVPQPSPNPNPHPVSKVPDPNPNLNPCSKVPNPNPEPSSKLRQHGVATDPDP